MSGIQTGSRGARKRGCGSFGCILFAGLTLIFVFLGFIFVTSMTTRAEGVFGPPAEHLGGLQRLQLGVTLGWRAEALRRPVDPGAGSLDFTIELGEPTGSIISRLHAIGLIRDGGLFRDYLVYSGLDTQLQAGEFELSAAMSGPEIARALLDPTPGLVTVAVLPGWRLEEIAEGLASAGVEISEEEFVLAARGRYAGFDFLNSLPEGASLEGYLLAGAYEVEREISGGALVRVLLGGFQSQVGADLLAGFEAQGLGVHAAVTLASIVERESVIEEEMPLIASVFLNRMASGLKLESDPTVQYALGFDAASASWWTNPLLTGHLSVNSPYNTYLVGGLPPGPIAAPSLEALRAVAFPQDTAYFFFRAACDGSGAHVFAETFEEHLANNCE